MHIAEALVDAAGWVEPPVVEHERDVAVHLDRFRLVDDQEPVQAAVELLPRVRCGWYQKVPASGAVKR